MKRNNSFAILQQPRYLLVIFAAQLLYILLRSSSLPLNTGPQTFAAIAIPAAAALFFAVLWIASLPKIPLPLAALWRKRPMALRGRAANMTALLALLLWGVFSTSVIIDSAAGSSYHADALGYLHLSALDVLHGVNPYTDSSIIWRAALIWPKMGSTPLQRGAFASCSLCFPSQNQVDSLMRVEALNPLARGPEWDPRTGHNYPAGSFLLAAPLVWAGLPSIAMLDILATFVIIGFVVQKAPAGSKITVLVASMAMASTFFTEFDALALVFILAAWQWITKTKTSAALVGIGCAVKQLAWFFAPFYLIYTWKRYGMRQTAIRAGWIAVFFLLPNLPFILLSPQAWLQSMFVPMSDPMFPVGIGFVSLSIGRALPLFAPAVYSILEFSAWGGLMVYQLLRRGYRNDGLIVALIPIFFARRALITYISLLPLFALWMITAQQKEAQQQQPAHSAPSFLHESAAYAIQPE